MWRIYLDYINIIQRSCELLRKWTFKLAPGRILKLEDMNFSKIWFNLLVDKRLEDKNDNFIVSIDMGKMSR